MPNSRRAFTLIELLVVIAIIGLLSTIAVVSLSSARSRGNAAKMAGDLHAIKVALDIYLNTNDTYPCFDHLWSDTWESTWSAPNIKWPKTPYNSHYHFEDKVGWATDPFTYSISLENIPLRDAQALDKLIDDNSLGTGMVRQTTGTDPIRVEWGGIDQNPPTPNPETCP